MADPANGHASETDDVYATLRALEPALTKTAALLPVLVDEVNTMKRQVALLPKMVEAIAAIHSDLAEIKALLRNGHNG